MSDGLFGKGEIKSYIDGDGEYPTVCGTGTDDYFDGSYEFREIYSTVYDGNVLKHEDKNGPPKWNLYRWHLTDPICFKTDLLVTLQALG